MKYQQGKILFSISLLIIVLVCFVFANGIRRQHERDMAVLRKTWDQLLDVEKYEIVGSWKNGSVTSFKYIENDSRYYVEPEFHKAELCLITFESEDRVFIGDVQKIVEMESYRIVGFNYRN